MTKYRIIFLLAIAMTIFGIAYQIYSSVFLNADTNLGSLLVIIGLGISIVNELANGEKADQKSTEQS